MNLKNKRINFLGDSITEGCGTSSPEHIFCNILKEKAGLALVRNYGIRGTRIARQKTPVAGFPQWDRDFISRVDLMDPDADAVVVFGGTNDFGHGDAPLGTFSDRCEDTFYGACHVLMRKLIERFPTCPIVILLPLHRRGEDDPMAGGVRRTTPTVLFREYIRVLREVAEYYALPVLDLYANSGIQPSVPVIREKFCPDGLHPNDAGHRIIASRLQGFLEAL